jgi:secreted trypsin-like serine protease
MKRLIRQVELACILTVLLAVGVCVSVAGASTRAHAAIIGGRPAADGMFPSAAFIVDFRGRKAGQCTGTVVAPTLVLTAGHCAENMSTGIVNRPSGYRVMTGSVNWASAQRQISAVTGVLVYEGFARRVDNGDAALLVLATPTTAPAITLATRSDTGELGAGTVATAAGWGMTSFEQGLPTETLQWADTTLQAPRWCARNAPPFFVGGELCTITPPSYGVGACEGDSGGPLIVPGAGGAEFVQVGIAVHVYGRCSTRRPTVFTRVDRISAWVHTWIEAYKPPPPVTPPPAPAPTPAP